MELLEQLRSLIGTSEVSILLLMLVFILALAQMILIHQGKFDDSEAYNRFKQHERSYRTHVPVSKNRQRRPRS